MLNYEKLNKFFIVVRKAGIELSIKVNVEGVKFNIEKVLLKNIKKV
jgi:hypothetical protein